MPPNGDRLLKPGIVDPSHYIPVACQGILSQPPDPPLPDGVVDRCLGTLWVPEPLVVCGINRFKRDDRSKDVQFDYGVRLRCAACGKFQEKPDIEISSKG